MKLLLPADLRARIEAEAREAFPRECCGLIEGARQGEEALATALHPARNIAARADRFEIAPEDHFTALKTARANGRDVIGCYHSHPDGKAAPSATDLAGAGEKDFFWLIASLSARDASVAVAAFVYSGAVFLPVDLGGTVGADLVTSSGESAQLTAVGQHVGGGNGRQHRTFFVERFRSQRRTQGTAMQEALAQHLAVGFHRFGARRNEIGQVLTFPVAADFAVGASYREDIACHGLGTIRFP